MLELNCKRFGYDNKNKVFYADASDVGVSPGKTPVSFVIVGKTGAKVEYRLSEKIRNNDGEVVLWRFTPSSSSLICVASCRGTQVKLFND
jgi:hypothetical protein